MAKANFWLGVVVGLLLGIFVLVYLIGSWVWYHHMFVIGITNHAASVLSIGFIPGLIAIGIVIGRVSKPDHKGKLDV